MDSKFSNVRDSRAQTPFENRMTDSAAKTQPQRKHLMFVGPSNIKRKKKIAREEQRSRETVKGEAVVCI